MATSGSKKKTGIVSNNRFYVRFDWKVTSQSVTGNYSDVAWYLYLVSDGSQWGHISSSTAASGSVTINGTKYSDSVVLSLSVGQTKCIHKGTTRIYHNSDGTKTFSWSWSQYFNIYWSGSLIGTVSDSGTGTLPTIARASNIASVTDVTIDGSSKPTVTWTAASSAFTHKIQFRVLDYSSGYIDIASGSTSYTYNSYAIPLDWMNSNTDKSQFSLAVDLQTYNGSTLIGEDSKLFYGTVGSVANPTVSLSVSKTGQTAVNAYVANKNGVSMTATAAGKYGATITDIKFYDGSTLLQSGTSTTCSISSLAAGTHTLKAVVTDTRGLTATATQSITVQSYAPPAVTSITAYRVASSGSTTKNAAGGYIYINTTYTYSSCGGTNSLSAYKAQYKKTSVTSWTDWGSHSSGTGYWAAFDLTSDYDIRFVLTDKFNTVYSQTVTVTGNFKLINVDGVNSAIAIGKMSTGNGFEVALDADFDGTLNVDGATTLGDTVSVEGGLTVDGAANFNDSITIPNSVGFYGKNTSGTSRNLVHINQSNESYYGYGGYAASEGGTNLCGNVVKVFAKGDITIGTENTTSTVTRIYSNRMSVNTTETDQLWFNGMQYGVNNVLWSGGSYMNASQTATLSEAISAQPHGIVLRFAPYIDNAVGTYGYVHVFIPKHSVALHNNGGHDIFMFRGAAFSKATFKYLYISDTKITGYNTNTATGTNSSTGITYDNSYYVLTHVIGV